MKSCKFLIQADKKSRAAMSYMFRYSDSINFLLTKDICYLFSETNEETVFICLKLLSFSDMDKDYEYLRINAKIFLSSLNSDTLEITFLDKEIILDFSDFKMEIKKQTIDYTSFLSKMGVVSSCESYPKIDLIDLQTIAKVCRLSESIQISNGYAYTNYKNSICFCSTKHTGDLSLTLSSLNKLISFSANSIYSIKDYLYASSENRGVLVRKLNCFPTNDIDFLLKRKIQKQLEININNLLSINKISSFIVDMKLDIGRQIIECLTASGDKITAVAKVLNKDEDIDLDILISHPSVIAGDKVELPYEFLKYLIGLKVPCFELDIYKKSLVLKAKGLNFIVRREIG